MRLSTVSNIARTLGFARRGIGLRNKYLLFFLAGFGGLWLHRIRLRSAILRHISSFGDERFVDVRFRLSEQPLIFSLRRTNEADYLIGSEFVRGVYDPPDFDPEEIVDGGANIELFAVVASSMFPNARLVCCEPDVENYQQLQRNLRLNNVSAECYRIGLWSKATTLYYHARWSHTGFISEDPSDIPISCIRPKIGRNCWLKLDIEMAEYEVLPALLNAGEYPRWITMEIHHYDSQGKPLAALLACHGYTMRGGEDRTAKYANVSAWRNGA
jgi:FkbM family methyltransferase